nr:MAG: RNA dependent RNA polymerase [Ustilaginoidea virens botourmiavirus 2]
MSVTRSARFLGSPLVNHHLVESDRPCTCRRAGHERRVALQRFLRVVRVRFCLGKGELPDLEESQFKSYLLTLLKDDQHPSTPFPRVQRGVDAEGFPVFVRLGRRERWEFALSLASAPRGVRTPPKCARHPVQSRLHEWKASVLSPPSLSPGYLQFVRRESRRIFRPGWDRSYDSFCESFLPNVSYRDAGGATRRAAMSWSTHGPEGPRTRPSRRVEFRMGLRGREVESWENGYRTTGGFNCLLGEDPHIPSRYMEVPTPGKVRPMALFDEAIDFLGPLHKTLYQHLKTKKWLLVGPPNPSRVASLCDGHDWFTSVDLVAASDGLSIEVAETILGVALASSTIPGRIQHLAAASLRPVVSTTDGPVRPVRGQMMGAYLSFPLLCVQSYLAARWATRGMDASYLVNGDDVIIATKRPISAGDYPLGFTLNDAKTVRFQRTVDINSTVFLRYGKQWKEVHSLRRGAFYDDLEGHEHMFATCKKAGLRWCEAAAVVGQRKW